MCGGTVGSFVSWGCLVPWLITNISRIRSASVKCGLSRTREVPIEVTSMSSCTIFGFLFPYVSTSFGPFSYYHTTFFILFTIHTS